MVIELRAVAHVVAVVTLVTTAVACGGDRPAAPPAVPLAGVGSFGSVAWVRPDLVVVTRASQGAPGTGRAEVVAVSVPSGTQRVIPVPGYAGCVARVLRAPTPLGGSRVGYLDVCLNDGSGAVRPKSRLMELDVDTGRAQPLVDLPGSTPTDVTWAPSLGRGYLEADSAICVAFWAFDRSGERDDPLPISDDGGDWDIAAGRRPTVAPRCGDAGRAGSPHLGEGGELVFLASPSSQRLDGQARLEEPWYVYAAEAGGFVPRRVSPAIAHARTVRAAPDRSVVAVSGEVRGTTGLWTFSPGADKFRLLLADDVQSFAWAPDGTRLAVAVRGDDGARLVVVDAAPAS